MFSSTDAQLMRRALDLAANGLFTTDPNPRVGCVIVREGQIVGEGWHQRAGEPHAEVHALQQAGALARQASVYLNLEPCSHQGRTPPCSDALIRAGVSRVVVAMQDPNPLVNGEGAEPQQPAKRRHESAHRCTAACGPDASKAPGSDKRLVLACGL
nr:bifunctional diaminohydroxyphosphoribosylaminopyrimidine deaminase/5-amino-6-(5-phosphoribosylamino)uracil reductase RibD [Betaproteobacteria bacterium]